MPQESAWERIIPVTDDSTIVRMDGGGAIGSQINTSREHLERLLNIHPEAVRQAHNPGVIDLNRQALRNREEDTILPQERPDIINEDYVRMLTSSGSNSLARSTTVTYIYPEAIDAFCTPHILYKYFSTQYPQYLGRHPISIYSPFVQFLRKNKFKSMVVIKAHTKERVTNRDLAIHYMQHFINRSIFCDVVDSIKIPWHLGIQWNATELVRLHQYLHNLLSDWFLPKYTKRISRTQSMG